MRQWELRKKLVGVITSASRVPRQQASPPTRHLSHFHCHTSADRRHRRRPTIIPPTSTNDNNNQPTSTIYSGADHHQPVGLTSKCFLFFLFLFRFTKYLLLSLLALPHTYDAKHPEDNHERTNSH